MTKINLIWGPCLIYCKARENYALLCLSLEKLAEKLDFFAQRRAISLPGLKNP
ncbi:hypothetical protein SBDP1_1550003 [Syntrophobacter sp. SbD1]|nr:hypothetical protein SBDP1_1550003 [Syntrophobacter sp. SbD1]